MTRKRSTFPKLTTKQLLDAIRGRWPWPQWVVFEELRAGTGFSQWAYTQAFDAWAIDTWGSHTTIAFEVKRTRSDYLSEMRARARTFLYYRDEAPTKRQAAIDRCDQFYFVVPANMVTEEECPEDSGLVWVHAGGRTRMVKEAPQRTCEFDRAFLASVCRRVKMNGATGNIYDYDPDSRVKPKDLAR